MELFISLLTFSFSFLLLFNSLFNNVVFCQPTSDLITDLPGLDWSVNYKQYSGYLKASDTHYLHYWFVESQNDPQTDPVVLWLNGGPGCSSLDGLLYEHGPFHVNDDGTLYKNDYAWNLYSNVLYLEAPIGVGFSYCTDNNYTMDDDTTANDNYNALLYFFEQFPEYQGRNFYVTGESYGGVYVPTLTLRILKGNEENNIKINIKGFAVGNGLSSDELNDDSSVWFAYYHGLVDEQCWNGLMNNCCNNPNLRQDCNFYNSSNDLCNNYVDQVMNIIYGGQLNWYNIYGDCTNTVDSFSHKKYQRSLDLIHRKYKAKKATKNLKKNLNDNVPCIDSTGADIYLNTASVKSAIHIPTNLEHIEWSICSDILNYTTIYNDLTNTYKSIYNLNDEIYTTIYNGDTDLSCNFLGDEWFIDDLNLTVQNDYREWTLNNDTQVAGWTKDFYRLHFVTVRGAGHMVPQWRPAQALQLFEYFLANKPL